jgi:hypothetical protein
MSLLLPSGVLLSMDWLQVAEGFPDAYVTDASGDVHMGNATDDDASLYSFPLGGRHAAGVWNAAGGGAGARIAGDIPANGAIAFGNAAVADDDASLYNMPSDNALSPIKVCSLVSIIPVSRTTLIGPCIGSIRMLTWSKDEAQRDETQPACCCFKLVLLRTQMTAMLRR